MSSTGWLLGLRGGLLAGLLAIPLNVLLFNLMVESGWEAVLRRWPGVIVGVILATGAGWLSDLHNLVLAQARELAHEREALQAQVVARQRAEETLHQACAVLEERIKERTVELSEANTWLKEEIAERLQAETALTVANAELELAVRRANELVAAAQEASRLKSEFLDDVVPLLTKIYILLQPQAEVKNIQLRISLPAGPILPLWVDPDRLRQILFNLVGNAYWVKDQNTVSSQ